MTKLNISLFTVLVLAFVVRLFSLTSLPLFGDEIDVGYQAFSILKTSRDVKGNFLPAYITSFSESRAPGLIYASIPAISIFGLNQFGVRLTPIIFGVISIYFFYKLIELHTKSSKTAIISALLLCFSPWHFHYSRIAFELTMLSAVILAAVYYFYEYVSQQKLRHLSLSIFLFSLSLYIYNIANVFVPLIFIYLVFSNFKKILNTVKPTHIVLEVILGVVVIFPILLSIISGSAANRFKLISIFNDQSITAEIINQRTDFTTSKNQLYEKLFHNKIVGYSTKFTTNYLTAFSPQFLVLLGDPNPRHNPPTTSLILLPVLLVAIIGLVSVYHYPKPLSSLFFYWLIIAPIPSALTQDGANHASRLFLMIFPIIYFSVVGLGLLSHKIQTLFYLSVLISLALYSHEYFVHYPKKYYAYWQYGYDQLFSKVPVNANHIFISNTKYESLPRYIFYQNIDPSLVQRTSDTEVPAVFKKYSGFILNQKTTFVNNWSNPDVIQQITQDAQTNDVYYLLQLKDIPGDMNFTKNPLPGFRTINTIYYPDGLIMGQVIQKI